MELQTSKKEDYKTNKELIQYYEWCASTLEDVRDGEAKSFRKAADYLRGNRRPMHGADYHYCKTQLTKLEHKGFDRHELAFMADTSRQYVDAILGREYVSQPTCEQIKNNLKEHEVE